MRNTSLMVVLGIAGFVVAFAATRWVNSGAQITPTKQMRAPESGMVWIPGGEFTMGTNATVGWADEKPAHRVRVDGFWIDEAEVTNAEFRAFIDATGYVTTAEKPPDVAIAGNFRRALPPKGKLPGSPVFVPPTAKVSLDTLQWWR